MLSRFESLTFHLLKWIFVCKVESDFAQFTVDDPSLSVCICVCVCVFIASDSSGAIEVIIIKHGTLSASDMVMLHVIIILTLVFKQGHIF